MTGESEYTPPRVWQWNKENGGQFAHINRPIAGPPTTYRSANTRYSFIVGHAVASK